MAIPPVPVAGPQVVPPQFAHNGKIYVITSITQRTGTHGEEIKIDLSTLSQPEIEAFVERAQMVMDVVNGLSNKPADLQTPRSLTLHVTRNHHCPELTELTLGRIFKRFRKSQDSILHKITYQETNSSGEKAFEIKPDSYNVQTRTLMLETTNRLNNVISFVIQNQQAQLPPHTYTPPPPGPVIGPPLPPPPAPPVNSGPANSPPTQLAPALTPTRAPEPLEHKGDTPDGDPLHELMTGINADID